MFRRNENAKSIHSLIDVDGLPYVGQVSFVPVYSYSSFDVVGCVFLLMSVYYQLYAENTSG